MSETTAVAYEQKIPEALTELDPKLDLGPLRARLREYFTEKEIGILNATIAMINLWNRIRISGH